MQAVQMKRPGVPGDFPVVPAVVIGSKYTGPQLDRPALRRLPVGWVLTVDEEQPPAFRFFLGLLVLLGGAWLFWAVIFSLEKVK